MRNKSTNNSQINNRQKQILNNKSPAKQLNKAFKNKRSQTTHLNQYSKLLILEKNQELKRSHLLKRHGSSLSSLIKSSGVTKRQFQDKFQNFQKIDQMLTSLKKKITEQPPQIKFQNELKINLFSQKQSDRLSRNIRTSQTNSRKSLHQKGASTGKLCLGKNVIPEIIPSKQQRWNPFYEKPHIITQNLINLKGVYNLLTAGILPKQYDFRDILNNKYELIEQKPLQILQKKAEAIIKIQEDNQTFMTNPALLSQYEQHKKTSQAELIESKNNTESSFKKQNKIRKTKLKKVKKIKNDSLEKFGQFLIPQLPLLVITNGKIQKNEEYKNYLKSCLKQGVQNEFFQFIQKISQFGLKYNIKKIRFKPNLPFIKKLSESNILHLIENHKILGCDRTVHFKSNFVQSVILRCIDLYKYKKLKKNLVKIQRIKKYFRTKRLFHQSIDKRFNYFKYRLGSFAEQQRKYIQEWIQKQESAVNYQAKIQIHILSKQVSYAQEISYYKLRQRLRSHMMRLFNTKVSHLIILADPDVVGNVKQQMDVFIKMVQKMGQKCQKITKNLPNIHIFDTGFKGQNISSTSRTYFGITEEIIGFVRQLSKQQKPVIIPYQSSKYLPFICETLNANLYGGTFTKESLAMILQDEDQKKQEQSSMNKNSIHQDDALQKKFIKKNQNQIHTFQKKIEKLKTFKLANSMFQDKANIYQLFKKHDKETPFKVKIKNKNQREFFEQLAQKIVTHKDSTKWILKLPKSKFSRGIAILQTNDLKIFQQKRKKAQLYQEDINQVASLMGQILKDKIILNHSNLMQRKQYLNEFFRDQNSFIQQFIQNSNKVCVFGQILPNGKFNFMGSYKKFYTNGVGFGASYPSEQIKESILKQLEQLSLSLFEENVFGYITFQLLYQEKTKKLYFLDLTPNLEEYSTLYFMYNSLFKSKSMYSDYFQFNTLPKNIFYCPFLDNNGNKFVDIESFLDQCRSKKVGYNSINQQGQKFIFLKNDPSMLSLITFSVSQFQSIKCCIEAIAFLVDIGGKFNQFDKKYIGIQNLKTDGLYMMDILWRLRQIKKNFQMKQINKNLDQNKKNLNLI